MKSILQNIHPIFFLIIATTLEVSGDALIRKKPSMNIPALHELHLELLVFVIIRIRFLPQPCSGRI
jgi:hypothetical protein